MKKKDLNNLEIHIINVVWGKTFIDFFLKYSLPNQWTNDNLIFLSNQKNVNVIYKIYTTDEDKILIQKSKIYKIISKYITFLFEIINVNQEDKYGLMNKFHQHAIDLAFEKNAVLIFLAPDVICSNNLFKGIYQFLLEGYLCVALPGVRLSKQNFIKDLDEQCSDLDLSPRKLVKMALNNLHIVSQDLIVNSKTMPSGWCPYYFKIDDHNLLIRAFHFHTLMIWPEKKSKYSTPIDINVVYETLNNLNKVKIITDSDDLVLFELTDNKNTEIYGKYFKRNILNLVRWCINYTKRFNRFNIKHKIFYRSSKKKINWIIKSIFSDMYVNKIYFLYLIFKIYSKSKRLIFKIINQPKKLIYLIHKLMFKDVGSIYYQAVIAPFIAKYFFWVFWPLFLILKFFKICFVVNIAGGVGHIIIELDYFFRRLANKDIDISKRYVWIRPPDICSLTCVKLYKDKFWFASLNKLLFYLLFPLTIYYKKITLDCGLSRLKWQLTDEKKYYSKNSINQTYLYQISKQENFNNNLKYFFLRKKTDGYRPLKLNIDSGFENLKNFINTDKKIALVHIKENICNASARITDVSTYLDALNYLKSLNYELVFCGREKMPKVFNDLSVINYAQSHLVSFENDIKLFNLASIAIINGSGVSYLADTIDLPYLYINSWHIHFKTGSEKCVVVPSLVLNKKTQKYLTVSEQISLYEKLPDVGVEIFPYEKYEAINASSEEILEALKELLSFSYLKLNYLQNKMDEKHFLIKNTMSKYSLYFLEKHSDLL